MAFAADVDEPRCTSLHEMLGQRAAIDPDRAVVIADGRSWTARDLLSVASAIAANVPPVRPDRPPTIVVSAPTRELLGLGVIAAATVGAAVPLQMDLPADHRAALVERVQPAVSIDVGEMSIDVGDTVSSGTAMAASVRTPALDDTAIVLSTSGSTAVPKLVPNTHRNLWASARAASHAYALGRDDRTLALGSMAHALGLRAVVDALWCGGTVVIPEILTVEGIARTLVEREPTCVIASPALLNVLASALESLDGADRVRVGEALRFVRSGSAALRPALADRLAQVLGTPVLHGYGMTEAAKIACVVLGESTPSGSVGRPLGVEVRIDNGEIVVRGDGVAPGYLDGDHQSASSFADGWFRTGDLGRLDDQGHLFLLGRKDDVVSRGGELVSLRALEHALEEHPLVAAALAAPIEHPSLGTDVVLAYVTVDDHTVRSSELRDFVSARLGAAHAPSRIVALSELPLTATGKPSRAALASMAALEVNPGSDEVDDATELFPELDGIELLLATMWCEILLVDVAVTADHDFFALGADSLHLVELCSAIEERFGIEVMPSELIERPRLTDMAALVRRGGRRTKRSILVPLRPGDPDRMPLYVVPGRGGTLAQVHRFVFRLEPGRPVYGFEAPGVYVGERPVRKVRTLAKRYVDELLAHVTHERFAIAGVSFGAVVAHEMAVQLEARGRPCALVAMFDCLAPALQPVRSRRGVQRLASRLRHPIESRRKTGLRPRMFRLSSTAYRASFRHRPRPTSTPVAMFTSEINRYLAKDPLLGWEAFLRGPVTRLEYPGLHRHLTRTHAGQSAPALDDLLRRAER